MEWILQLVAAVVSLSAHAVLQTRLCWGKWQLLKLLLGSLAHVQALALAIYLCILAGLGTSCSVFYTQSAIMAISGRCLGTRGRRERNRK